MQDVDQKEFISVIVTMGILFILALVAVAIFIRQWRRERGGQSKKQK